MSSVVDASYARRAVSPETIEAVAAPVVEVAHSPDAAGQPNVQDKISIVQGDHTPSDSVRVDPAVSRRLPPQFDLGMLLSGLLFVMIGGCALAVATSYPIGSAARMGPGFFPTLISVCLIGVGALIAAGSWFATGEAISRIRARAPGLLLGSLLLFALAIDRLGLILASLLAVLVGGLAVPDSRWRGLLVLAAGLTAFAWLVFVKLLVHRFRSSNHIRRPGRAYRTKCGRRDGG
jgi:MFS family permease